MKVSTQKQILVLLCALLVLAILCVCLWGLSSNAVSESDPHAFAVYISEVLASNSAYPDFNGNYHDFVEICNSADGAVDLSGFHLTDDDKELKYTFPEGTYLQPGGYLVVWCETDGKDTANFSISKSGGETIFLMNRKNVIVDSVVTIPTKRNLPMVPTADGSSWTLSSFATPGFPNTQAGYDAYLASRMASGFPVVISEVVSSNKSYLAPDGNPHDFIELYNPTAREVDLSGCRISDDPEDMKDVLPNGTVLAAGEYRVLWCGCEGGLSFKIASDGSEPVLLRSPGGDVIDSVSLPALEKDTAYAKDEKGDWHVTGRVTPGKPNVIADPVPEEEKSEEKADVSQLPVSQKTRVVISEVMADNATTLLVGGSLPDWVELCNEGSEAEFLKNWYLSDNPGNPEKYALPEITLAPNECLLLICDGEDFFDGTYYHTDFSISRYGEILSLVNDAYELASYVELPELGEDCSLLCDRPAPVQAEIPTPGFPNTDSGLEEYQASLAFPGGLYISELMTFNESVLQQPDDKYYDWVEICNGGNEPVDVSGVSLSDSFKNPGRYVFTDLTLQPGEYCVAVLSDGSLGLNAEDETVYLFDASGVCVDCLRVRGVPVDASFGRMPGESGFFYFADPTPGSGNTDGKRTVADKPVLSLEPGIYNDVQSLNVALESGGTVYYTLDGSWPTERSQRYSSPLTITETTVLRAFCVQDGSLPSAVLSAAYIVNENHTFPVVSLTMNPDGFSYMYRNYYSDIETPSNMTFYDTDGSSFSIDCGTRMFGSLSRETLEKKSMKVIFRASYGKKTLKYPLYENSDVDEFHSLVLRSGQDCTFAMIREELMTSLAKEGSDSLQTVNTRYVILYVNGEYWGIYNLKEAFSEEFFASHNGVSPESTRMVRMTKLTEEATDLWDIMKYCHKADMTSEENYKYLTDNIDIESMTDWIIFEAYCSNSDLLNNVRYVKSDDLDGKWKHCYYDLDWSFRYNTATLPIRSGEMYAYLPKAALQNSQYRRYLMERLAYHLENSLSTEHVLARIDELTGMLAPEIERDWDRWNLNTYNYEYNVQIIRDYVSTRPKEMIAQITGFWGESSSTVNEIFGGVK